MIIELKNKLKQTLAYPTLEKVSKFLASQPEIRTKLESLRSKQVNADDVQNLATRDKFYLSLLVSVVSSELPTTATVVHNNMCCGKTPPQPEEEKDKESGAAPATGSSVSLSGGGGGNNENQLRNERMQDWQTREESFDSLQSSATAKSSQFSALTHSTVPSSFSTSHSSIPWKLIYNFDRPCMGGNPEFKQQVLYQEDPEKFLSGSEHQIRKHEVSQIYKHNIQGIDVDYVKFIDIFEGKEAFLLRRMEKDESYSGGGLHDEAMKVSRFKHNKDQNGISKGDPASPTFMRKMTKSESIKQRFKQMEEQEIETNLGTSPKSNTFLNEIEMQKDIPDSLTDNKEDNKPESLVDANVLQVVQIRKANRSPHVKWDIMDADFVCVIPEQFSFGLNQYIHCLVTDRFEMEVQPYYKVIQEVKQINSNKTSMREGLAMHCSRQKVADIIWVNKNLSTQELKEFHESQTYVLKQIFYYKKSPGSLHLETADWWTIFPEHYKKKSIFEMIFGRKSKKQIPDSEQAQQPLRRQDSYEITTTSDVIINQQRLTLGRREDKNWKCMMTDPVVRRTIRCYEEEILPEQQVSQFESKKESLTRVGILLHENFNNNKFKEKKHNVLFVDKKEDAQIIKQYLDQMT